MAFHERWFAAGKPKKYAEALSHVPQVPGALVEVGVWEGKSTIQLANAFPAEEVHAIDHWQGDLTDPKSPVAAIAASRNVFADFMENIKLAGVADRVVVHRMDWRDAFARWSYGPIKMLFIDGEHTFTEVADNIDAGLPLMVPGGVMCGDDYGFSAVAKAVHSRLDERGQLTVLRGTGAAFWYWVNA